MLAVVRDPYVGMVVADLYRLEERVAQGGMSIVYKATHLRTQFPVAIKLIDLRSSRHPHIAERADREAKALLKLRSAHIVQATDVGLTDTGHMFITMEFLAGETLHATIEREGAFAWPRATHIAKQVCRALSVAHQHDIVHRDMKPLNCMRIQEGTEQDFIKVIDFGISKFLSASLPNITLDDAIPGTPEYMAPELFHGDLPNIRTDIYAIGATLYHMLTGHTPFYGTHRSSLPTKICNGDFAPPSRVVATVDPRLDRLILRAMATDPKRRYPSVTAMLGAIDALEQELSPEPAFERKTTLVFKTSLVEEYAASSLAPSFPAQEPLGIQGADAVAPAGGSVREENAPIRPFRALHRTSPAPAETATQETPTVSAPVRASAEPPGFHGKSTEAKDTRVGDTGPSSERAATPAELHPLRRALPSTERSVSHPLRRLLPWILLGLSIAGIVAIYRVATTLHEPISRQDLPGPGIQLGAPSPQWEIPSKQSLETQLDSDLIMRGVAGTTGDAPAEEAALKRWYPAKQARNLLASKDAELRKCSLGLYFDRKLTFRADVAGDGHLVRIRPVEPPRPVPKVVECVKNIAKTLTFPPHSNGGSFDFSFDTPKPVQNPFGVPKSVQNPF